MSKQETQAWAKARVFFERARRVTKTGNFDQAIDMYLAGLRYAPDEVQKGHIELRELAILRKEKGGKKPTTEEVAKRLQGKSPLERMLNAEYLLVKDPEYLPYAEAMLKAAVEGGYKETVKWIADLMFLANNGAKKPSLQIYVLLKDSYTAVGQYDRALAACQRALKIKPDNTKLQQELKELSAKVTLEKAELEMERVLEQSVKGQQADEEQLPKTRFQAQDYSISAIEQPQDSYAAQHFPEKNPDAMLAKARIFFEKAQKAAQSDNFDYAIDMYLEGLRWAPDALEEGHLPLAELALVRREKGGKKPSMVERVKRMRSKDSLEQMLNAEYLFTKDPDHLPYAESMLKAAVAGGYNKTADWIANVIFQANNASDKPSLQTYIMLKDSYASLGKFDKAVAACQWALKLKPKDAELARNYKDLSAELTMSKGKYDLEGDFTQSIKDREEQAKLYAQDRVVKTEDYRLSAVQRARETLAQNPNLHQNIFNLAAALSDLETDEAENEAIQLLENAYQNKRDFSYKQRAGLLRIKQLKRKLKQAKNALQEKPDDEQAQAKVEDLSKKLNEAELGHYRLNMENYPTNLQAKYEYALRLIRSKRYDEAIPLFQEAQKDPRRKIAAMNQIGFCFFMKGWFADAIDVFRRAIDAYEIKEDAMAKELQYNLARAYEKQGELEKALEVYRKIAQLDFAYKDVSKRVDKLRNI